MKCPKCGNQLNEGALICPMCRTRIRITSQADPVSSETETAGDPFGKVSERFGTAISEADTSDQSKTDNHVEGMIQAIPGLETKSASSKISMDSSSYAKPRKTPEKSSSGHSSSSGRSSSSGSSGTQYSSSSSGDGCGGCLGLIVILGLILLAVFFVRPRLSGLLGGRSGRAAETTTEIRTGWVQDEKGWRYYNENGSFHEEGWFEDEDGRWYYFDEDGYMMKDTVTPDGYTLGSDGAMIGETGLDGYAFSEGSNLPPPKEGEAPRTINGFVLPDSSERILEMSELEGMTAWEARIARNEIYARHGRKYQTPELKNWFEAQEWYHGTTGADSFNENSLSEIERANVSLILKYEEKL